MRRREASDDEEEEERERPLRRIDSRAAIGSDGESDGQGAAAEYDDEESEIEEEELEVEEEEEEEEVEADVVEEGEHEVRAGKDSVEIGGEDEKELDGDGRRSVGESMELFQGVNQVEEEKKENEPFAVPTAGAFYMHDDMFRDSAGGGRHSVTERAVMAKMSGIESIHILILYLSTISLTIGASAVPVRPLLRNQEKPSSNIFDTSKYGILNLNNGLAVTPQMGAENRRCRWWDWELKQRGCSIGLLESRESSMSLVGLGIEAKRLFHLVDKMVV